MTDEAVQIITTISEITAIFIRCDCGEQLILKRRSLDETLISGTFCRKCDEQYWIRWSEGVVRREFTSQKEVTE